MILGNPQASRSWRLKRNGVFPDCKYIEKMLMEKLGHPTGQNRWVTTMNPFYCDDDDKYLPRCFNVFLYLAVPVSKEWMEHLFSDERWWSMESWDMSDEDMEWLIDPYDD